MTDTLRSVDTPHYHVWTDALHGRELARRSRDAWNRGTYVRWTVVSACTALEIACEQYLARSVSNRFKEDVNAACHALGVGQPDWSQGLWQRVLELRDARNQNVHAALPRPKLFAEVAEAENAIAVVRQAVLDIAARTRHPAPVWVTDDKDLGAGQVDGVKFGSFCNGTAVHAGVTPEAPDTLRICYEYKGREFDTELLPPDPTFDPTTKLEDLARRVNVPASAVRAYRGLDLLKEIKLNLRGS